MTPATPPATTLPATTALLPLDPLGWRAWGLTHGRYRVLVVDPPWSYSVYNSESGPVTKAGSKAGNRGIAERHYPTMPLRDLAALPLADLADPAGCALCLWVTAPCLGEAFALLDAWGFAYKTMLLTWVKTNKGSTARDIQVTGRLGHYTRGSTEYLLLATRGRAPKRVDTRVEQVVFAPRGVHSRKPDESYARIVRLWGEVRRAELFARATSPGFDAWGLEAGRYAPRALEQETPHQVLPSTGPWAGQQGRRGRRARQTVD
jgi:N6-adenosine-specific RNA methylase IME4